MLHGWIRQGACIDSWNPRDVTLVRAFRTLLSFAVLACACSLTPIPDLTSGSDLGPILDRDSGRADGGAGAEGGGGVDGGASPNGFCKSLAPQPMFCDDFDDGSDLSARWELTPFQQKAGAYGVSVDTTSARSQPRSIVSRVEANAPDCAYATLKHDVAGQFHGTYLGYSVRLASADDVGDKSTISAQFIGGGNDLCQAFLTVFPDHVTISEQIIHGDGRAPEENDYPLAQALPVGAWTRVEIRQDFDTKKLTVALEGKEVFSGSLALACPYVGASSEFHVGLFCEPAGMTSRRINVDDVVIDAH